MTPSGSKIWRWKYRVGGREKKLTLGPYPLLSMKAAREARDAARMQMNAGTDPGAVKREAKRKARIGESFKEIACSWHAGKKAKLTPRYAKHILSRLEANIFPQFGSLPIKDITPPMVLEAIRRIEARGANTMAHEVRGHVSEVLVWAIASGLAETDPAAIIRKALSPAGGGRRSAVLSI
ncbi:tyrosine-type recombinase/integrase [Aurantiacibacter flavus]|uniref:Integrase arm-type DNA-binding domain-containing protein n=1 Tax=Aurantiacibacter flavus TaxID=3145232 RepID=A0ABV0CUR9_9SPHN